MPLTADQEPKARERKEWPVIPEDVYPVQITDIIGEQAEWKGEKKDVYKFEFTIIEDGAYYGRKLWKKGSRVTPIPYANGKNPLTWSVVSAVFKHSFTEDEGKSFGAQDFNALIGKQLRVGVKVTPPKDGKQYNNVEGFYAAKAELPPFDEGKVKKDAPASPATPAQKTPADIAEASGGKFTPTQANLPVQTPAGQEQTADVDFGEVNVDDIPF